MWPLNTNPKLTSLLINQKQKSQQKFNNNQMADNKQSFQAGQAAGRAEEKSNVLMDKVKDAACAAGASAQTAGQKITEAAGGAVNIVKEKTGMNK